MKNIRENLPAKVAAYILMMICVMAWISAAIVTALNIDYGWYSKSKEDAHNDIYYQVASYAGTTFINEMSYLDNTIEEYSAGRELIENEDSSTKFGYRIYEISKNDKDIAVKEVNPDLKAQNGTYIKKFEHEHYGIEIYLGDLDEKSGVPGEIASEFQRYNGIYNYRYTAATVMALTFIAFLCFFIFLCVSVGRCSSYNESRDGKQSFIRKLPADVVAFVAVMLLLFVSYNDLDIIQAHNNYDVQIAAVILGGTAVIGLSTCFILFFITKVRLGNWWESTWIYKIFMVLKWLVEKGIYLLKSLHLVWKTALLLLVGLIINFYIMMNIYYGGDGIILLWFAGAILLSAAVIYMALGLKKLKAGGKHLAEGDLDYKIDKKGLIMDFAEHADALNSISIGMSKAVAEKMKSERFKTELITNVSHDIKTPLTSIINYIDFLKNENIKNDKAKEYLDVLDRQSQRLKKLTEDLVEASKAATGNIKMNMEPCQIGLLMTQSMAEYEEKANKEDIKLMMNLPDSEIKILADGRSMWRVIDNLLNNICKYTQPGTRVYQTLEVKDGRVIITYKNISKYELNITGEELTERFVRGDSSRHTEGSGLGLSIAHNLIELQKGTFKIDVDGDLFKVTIEFDMIGSDEQS